jgi:hypothetical protein
VAGMFWYVSRSKIEALRDDYGSPGPRRLKDISLKLKSPFAEAGATLDLDRSIYRDVEQIAANLIKAPETESFPRLSADHPTPFFSFVGPARRSIDSGAYWIALFKDKTALLLAGSISNAVGASTRKSDDAISPSADPIGTIEVAFGEGRSAEDKVSVGSMCAYIWQTIVEPVRADWHTLPAVEGMAVYGGMFSAEMNLEDVGEINKIVIGTPVYVRQR